MVKGWQDLAEGEVREVRHLVGPAATNRRTAHACILIRAVWYMVHNSLLALILWMWNEKKRPHVLWHSLIGQSRWVSQQQQLMSR